MNRFHNGGTCWNCGRRIIDSLVLSSGSVDGRVSGRGPARQLRVCSVTVKIRVILSRLPKTLSSTKRENWPALHAGQGGVKGAAVVIHQGAAGPQAEGVMSKIYQAIAVLILTLVGLLSVDYESRAAGDVSPVPAADMQKTLRDLWLGHIFMIQHAVLYNMAYDMARDAADKQVLANVRQIANTFTPYYGEARCEKLFALLASHYSAVKEYSEATSAGNKSRQDAALASLGSNADLIDAFFNEVNPHYLPKGTVRGLIAAHGSHHVLQINQYKKKEYAQLEQTWSMMRKHVHVIADTLTTALVKQFPGRFS